jgi:hypothetical protein
VSGCYSGGEAMVMEGGINRDNGGSVVVVEKQYQ